MSCRFTFCNAVHWSTNVFNFDKAKLIFCHLCVKKLSSNPKLQNLLLFFFVRSFICLAFTFVSVIHFELIVVYDVKEKSTSFILHVDISVSQYYLLKRLFLCQLCWYPVWKTIHHMCESLRIPQSSPTDQYVYVYANITLDWLLWFYSKFWNKEV